MAFTEVVGGAIKLNSGYYMPMIGLGTYKITGQEAILKSIDAALNAGYRMFDTAKYYVNEPELGIALEELLPKYKLQRSDIFLTTKFFPAVSGNREFAKKMVNESLANLKTNYLDLVLIHYPKASESSNEDPVNATNRMDAYKELEALKEAGQIHSIGVSNYESRHIEEIKKYSSIVPSVNQVEYHPHFTREELRNYCNKENIFFQAFSSLARHNPDLLEDETLLSIAKKYSTSPQTILLSWPLHNGVGIIPKSTNPERIAENLKTVDVKLSADDVQALNNLNRNKHYIRCEGWLVV